MNRGFQSDNKKNVASRFGTQNSSGINLPPQMTTTNAPKPSGKSVWENSSKPTNPMPSAITQPRMGGGIFHNPTSFVPKPTFNTGNILGSNSVKMTNQKGSDILDSEMNDSDMLANTMNMNINGDSYEVDMGDADNIGNSLGGMSMNMGNSNFAGTNGTSNINQIASDLPTTTLPLSNKPQTFEEALRQKYGIFKII
jgi:hypothetical protein